MELPYRAEYAKSSRSACKKCKGNIEKEQLRLATMIQSPKFDSKIPNWYHFSCFFERQRVKSVGDISHFESLRWEDQQKIQEKIAPGTSAPVSLSNGTPAAKTTKRKSTKSDNAKSDFLVEYAKSSRATCRGCEAKIVKDEVRASRKDYESEEALRYGGIDMWHHLECFVKLRNELEFWQSGSKLPGFKTLQKEDQDKIKKVLPEIKPIKKEKSEDNVDGDGDGVSPDKKPKIEGNILEKQNRKMFNYRDQLKSLTKKELILLLQYNGQQYDTLGHEKMLDRLADAMTFGALLKCPECRGQIVFRSGVGYFCLGYKDEWVKCESVMNNPPKKPFCVPEELKTKSEFLNNYKYKPEERVIQANAPSLPSTSYSGYLSNVKSEPTNSGPKIERNLPLRNMEFVLVGKLKMNREELKREILKLGGKVISSVGMCTTAVISNQKSVDERKDKIPIAETYEIQVVPIEFIEECKTNNDVIANINKMNLATWGSDPSKRIQQLFDTVDSKSKSASNRYKSTMPSKVKLKIKGGVAVDQECEVADIAHVYQTNTDIFNVALCFTDVQSNKNSFYKLQLLESDDKRRYWLFRSWGRIGTTIGGNKCEELKKEEAFEQFKFYFLDKTANTWDNRKNFVKVPGSMVLMDISYDDDKVINKTDDVPSKLPKPVQDLVSLIFNVNKMQDVMKEYELDLEKMPLGKLSKKQISEAYSLLNKLQNCILKSDGKTVGRQEILRCSNQFYSLIPHATGINAPPLLDNTAIIKNKTDILETLLELEIAYSIVKDSEIAGNKEEHFVDSYYFRLKTEVNVLERESREYELIQSYIKNTHAETHKNYELEILEVFKVNRQGEHKRFKPFEKLGNRKLLWHGSRLTNFAGILSQGLRIAPPEAPVAGYMFGKGIYFADMVSKSANYCITSPLNNTGLLLLCEVALGNMHELFKAKNITKLPEGKHSVKGIGQTTPAPDQSITLDNGVEIPLGKGIKSQHKNTSLLYNEYIVYDVSQVKIQYLVEVKFNYTF